MTSGTFTYLPVNSITVDRETRQRRELKGIPELAQSIADNGLINPIVVTRENVLVAGERRLTAHQQLGFETIAVQYMDDLDPTSLHTIELEENVRRLDLDWPDRVRAVAQYHQLKSSGKSGWSQDDTAHALNLSATHVSRYMLVDKMLKDGVPEVVDAPQLSTAMGFAQRAFERQKASVLRDIKSPKKAAEPIDEFTVTDAPEDGPTILRADSIPKPHRYAELRQADFLDFAKLVPETPYNFIHCDFPYGVNAGDTKGYSARKSLGGYEDTKDIYFTLLNALCEHGDKFIDGSAHLMFWFSMDYYAETKAALESAGWRINPFPLVWHKSDNTGIMPDAQRGPRRIYETAFMGTKGDRKVVRPVANSASHPGKRGEGKQFHMSEKSVPMLDHFFRMFVDANTIMLDPTCGSGNAVKASEAAGAYHSLGLELNPEYLEKAKENLDL